MARERRREAAAHLAGSRPTRRFRLVHVLWDPLQACGAQWPAAAAAAAEAAAEAAAAVAEVAVAEAAAAATALYLAVRRDANGDEPADAVQARETAGAAGHAAAPRILCHGDRDLPHGGSCSFLGLTESKSGDLMQIATDAMAELGLRGKVFNRRTFVGAAGDVTTPRSTPGCAGSGEISSTARCSGEGDEHESLM